MASQSDAAQLAVVTGGVGDIGSAIAKELAATGWNVALMDIREDSVGALKAAAIAEQTNSQVTYHQVDQCDLNQMEQVFAKISPALVVITAATVQAQPFLEIELDAWKRQIDLNLTGSFIAAQVSAKAMLRDKIQGQVIFISSWVASRPWPEITAYTASKAGVEQLMRQMALELAPSGIRANAVAPGIVKAGLAKHQLETEPEYARRVATAIPLGKLQEAEDIAKTVGFMASLGAASMTGSVLTIDGGCTLGQIR